MDIYSNQCLNKAWNGSAISFFPSRLSFITLPIACATSFFLFGIIPGVNGMRIEDILLKYNFDTEEAGQLIERKYKEIVFQNYESIVDEIDIAGLLQQQI